MDGPFSDGCFYLQQDRSRIHMARSVTELLEDRGVMVLEWPPQGPDMNIIENVWGAMKKSLSHRPLHRRLADDLWAAVEAEWERLRASDLVTSLFECMPRRMASVLAAGGDFTKY
uniref:Putative tc1 transposase tc1-like transposase n=1 Tax=Ixodes ricinus TaxID=34613 RepID=A0A6B0UKW5_IXORI